MLVIFGLLIITFSGLLYKEPANYDQLQGKIFHKDICYSTIPVTFNSEQFLDSQV